MASACACGCGRQIEGLRPRANNEIAVQITRHLSVMQGALARGDAGSRTEETRAMVDEGVALLAPILGFLHGEVQRDELDKGRTKQWTKQGGKLADALLAAAGGPGWEPEDPRTDHLAHAGERAHGVVTDVRTEGWGNDRTASLRMSVSARTLDGRPIELSRRLAIAVVKVPRVGDAVEVAFDPTDLERFVFRPMLGDPTVAAPDASAAVPTSTDRVGRLRELAELLEQGLLTRDEFDAEKARLLAE